MAHPYRAQAAFNVTTDVPTIVHNLICDMKALEAALFRWSGGEASPDDVSKCYVQFGVEFNAVVRAFEGYNIPMRCATPRASLCRA